MEEMVYNLILLVQILNTQGEAEEVSEEEMKETEGPAETAVEEPEEKKIFQVQDKLQLKELQ